ncbi:hypothetical protein EDEG_02434 [Edhazardia aedis USNM 41457]|uniref:Arrestin-like N-terminal domain-containing protein n=1 Tax=Edhazardia aedis (strain USNM 41457) TaxID=1003232 RepID=J9D5X4_EDHAE|nr:hypothetical protein EDEG_02434 [Edhazardia aedis USNM 41457]|eukprot:EJW03181.1 hypothetical protein EDEG_02434 [Edhazardia aedis USNM 41457]
MNTNNTVNFYIILDNEYFTCDEIISGTVHLKTKTPLNLEKIEFTLTKESYSGTDPNYTPKEVYKHKFDLFNATANSCIKISTGHHTYPFRFYLKPGDNASCKTKLSLGTTNMYIHNVYTINSNLKIYGIFMPVKSVQKRLNIIDTKKDEIYKKSENLKIELSSCMFFLRSYFSIDTVFNKLIYYTGDQIKLQISCKGKCSLYHVESKLYQNITIVDGAKSVQKCKLVAKYASKASKNCAVIDMPVPADLPSTTSEASFEISYFVKLVVKLNQSVPLKWNRNVFIVKRHPKQVIDEGCHLLKGMEAPMKYLSLH